MEKDTNKQFDAAIKACRDIYMKKLTDYGPSWRILRASSLTDQIFIKANRIRNLQIKKVSKVGEGILPEFIAIVNYGIIGLIQLELGDTILLDITSDKAAELYDRHVATTREKKKKKNADYDEAWRSMRVSSFADIILQKIMRTKQIEDNKGQTIISEGIDANYQDMINYAIFAIIKLSENDGGEA